MPAHITLLICVAILLIVIAVLVHRVWLIQRGIGGLRFTPEEPSHEMREILAMLRLAGRFKTDSGVRVDEFFHGYQEDLNRLEAAIRGVPMEEIEEDKTIGIIVKEIIKVNSNQVGKAVEGNQKAFNSLVGQVMKRLGNNSALGAPVGVLIPKIKKILSSEICSYLEDTRVT